MGYEVLSGEVAAAGIVGGSATLIIIDQSTSRLFEDLSSLRYPNARTCCLALSSPTGEQRQALRRLNVPLFESASDPLTTLESLAPALDINIRTDPFVSYSRHDQATADALIGGLAKQGLRPWLDRRELLASEEWQRALRRGVESSDSFLMLVSHASLASSFCAEELGWAEELGKRIIPVLIEDLPAATLPDAISKRQFIRIAEGSKGQSTLTDATITHIADELRKDPQNVRRHRDLLTTAIDWKKSGRSDKLLRGQELRDAEDWLGRMSARRTEPLPVALQIELIAASRAAARRRVRLGSAIAAAAVAVTSALAIWAIVSAQQAGSEKKTAQSRLAEQRAYGAFVDWDAEPVRSFLLADSATRSAPPSDLQRPVYALMAASLAAGMPAFTYNLETDVSTARFSDDLAQVVVQPVLGNALLFTLENRAAPPLQLLAAGADLRFKDYAFSLDRRRLAALGRDAFAKEADPTSLVIWDTASGKAIVQTPLRFLHGSSPHLLGFTGDSTHVVIETTEPQAYTAYVVPTADAAAASRAPWRSTVHFFLGQLDLESSIVLRISVEAGSASRIELLDARSGAQAFSWSPLTIAGTVVQAYISDKGKALTVLTKDTDASSVKLSAFRLTDKGAEPIGKPLEAPGPAFIYRTTSDGSAAAIINKGADYPGELWLPAEQTRLTVPTGLDDAGPYVRQNNEEFRWIDLLSSDRFVVVRATSGPQQQKLLVFERTSMRLAAAPFMLPLSYITMAFAKEGTSIATVSGDGLVERWDLLRRHLPNERVLPVPGPILSATFLPDRRTLLTAARVRRQSGFACQIDLWDAPTGRRIGGTPRLMDIRTEYAIDAPHSLMVTAEKSGSRSTVQLWSLKTWTPLWSILVDAPIEAIAFRRQGAEVLTAGLDDSGTAVLVQYEAATGRIIGRERDFITAKSVHLAFSLDGEIVVGDYDYASVVMWSIAEKTAIGEPLLFSESGGMPFDLGYDLIKDLRNIRREGQDVVGDLPGGIAVKVIRDGQGTVIKPIGDDTPILSAYERGNARLYPVRGSDLVSADGAWFALATNSTGVAHTSSLRIFDLRSGLPVSYPLLHQVLAQPGRPWPSLLSSSVEDADPIEALTFVGDDADVLTVTTNGLLRRWQVESAGWGHTDDNGTRAALLTGRQLVSARYVRRLPRDEYERLLRNQGAK